MSLEQTGTRHTFRPFETVCVVFLTLVAPYLWLSLDGDDLVYQAVGLGAAAAIVVGIRIWRPAHPRGWHLLATGVLLFSIADAFTNFYDIFLHRAIPFPSVADPLYLVEYVFLGWGLVSLARADYGGAAWGLILEGGIFGVATAAVGWAVLFDAMFTRTATSTLARIFNVAYPFADVVLLGILAGTAFATASRTRTVSYLLLVAGVVAQLAGDVVFAFLQQTSGYSSGDWVDLLWLSSYGLLAAAAVHPSMRRLTAPPEAAPKRGYGRLRLAVVGIAVVVGPLAVVARSVPLRDEITLGFTLALMAALVGGRFWSLLRQREAAEMLAGRSQARLDQLVRSDGAPATILVVEDNLVNQKVALAFLQQLGYHCDVAADGRQALEAMARTTCDAVLMDCQVPRLDGYQTTLEIRNREGDHRRTPVVAMTTSAMDADRDHCLAVGMDDHLAKPIRPDDLAAVLHRWVAHRNPA